MQVRGSEGSFLNSSLVSLPFSLNVYKLKVKRMYQEVPRYVKRLKFNPCELREGGKIKCDVQIFSDDVDMCRVVDICTCLES